MTRMEARSLRICVIATSQYLLELQCSSAGASSYAHAGERCERAIWHGVCVARATVIEVEKRGRAKWNPRISGSGRRSVPQLIRRGTGRPSRHRPGKLGANGGKQAVVAGNSPQFRPGNRFHRVDQHRQPRTLAACRPPSLDLLTHRLVLPVRYAWQLDKRRPVPDFLTTPSAAKKITSDVIYFTEAPGGPS